MNRCRRCWKPCTGRYCSQSCRETTKRAEIREAFLNLYGRVCHCCGCDVPEFLSVGHVGPRGTGDRHRRASRRRGWQMYAAILREIEQNPAAKSKYVLECASCNFARARFGYCPHQRGTAVGFKLKRGSNAVPANTAPEITPTAPAPAVN